MSADVINALKNQDTGAVYNENNTDPYVDD